MFSVAKIARGNPRGSVIYRRARIIAYSMMRKTGDGAKWQSGLSGREIRKLLISSLAEMVGRVSPPAREERAEL